MKVTSEYGGFPVGTTSGLLQTLPTQQISESLAPKTVGLAVLYDGGRILTVRRRLGTTAQSALGGRLGLPSTKILVDCGETVVPGVKRGVRQDVGPIDFALDTVTRFTSPEKPANRFSDVITGYVLMARAVIQDALEPTGKYATMEWQTPEAIVESAGQFDRLSQCALTELRNTSFGGRLFGGSNIDPSLRVA